ALGDGSNPQPRAGGRFAERRDRRTRRLPARPPAAGRAGRGGRSSVGLPVEVGRPAGATHGARGGAAGSARGARDDRDVRRTRRPRRARTVAGDLRCERRVLPLMDLTRTGNGDSDVPRIVAARLFRVRAAFTIIEVVVVMLI